MDTQESEMDLAEQIARVIAPDAFKALDAVPLGKGPTYEQIWSVPLREEAREKARAILALLPPPPRDGE
jgi:hypothetical protein